MAVGLALAKRQIWAISSAAFFGNDSRYAFEVCFS